VLRLLVLLLAVVVAGCGSAERVAQRHQAATKAQTRPQTCRHEDSCFARSASLWNCSHPSRGFRACTAFRNSGEETDIYRRAGRRWVRFAGPAQRHGWWIRVQGAPNRRTALAQWSGECERQTTYLVDGGRVRPVFAEAESFALGWAGDGRARVRVPIRWEDPRGDLVAGTYLVDPRTLEHKLEHRSARGAAC
jgi:hypothetical protein